MERGHSIGPRGAVKRESGESEYYIKYNRQVAHSWYKLWQDQGGSRASWEKYFKDLRGKEKGKDKKDKF